MTSPGLGRGYVVAALTPFIAGTTDVDGDRFDAQLEFVAGFAPTALTVAAVEVQEYHVLGDAQRVDLVRRAAAGPVGGALVAGVSHADVGRAGELAATMADAGATHVLAVAAPKPWGAPPSDAEVVAWYHGLAEASPVPVFLYNNPRTGVDVSVEAIVDIARHPNVAAMKETSRSVIKLLRLCDEVDVAGHARVYTNMESIQATLASGGSGAMMPPPALAVATALLAAIDSGDDEEARRLQSFFGRFPSSWMTLGLGPAVKAAMEVVGCGVGDPVRPYQRLGAADTAALADHLRAWGLAPDAAPSADGDPPTPAPTRNDTKEGVR